LLVLDTFCGSGSLLKYYLKSLFFEKKMGDHYEEKKFFVFSYFFHTQNHQLPAKISKK